MANRAEIHIRLGGSSAATINKRATALSSLAKSVTQLSAAAKKMPNVSTAANQYAAGLTRASKATKTMTRDAHAAGNALDNFGTLFARMVRIMAAFAIITAVVTAIRELVTLLVAAPAQLELWNAQLVTLSGSATIAAEKLELLKTVAIETPLELPDLFQGLTTLRAFNVEMSDRTLPLIADLAAVSGRTFQDISEVVGKVIQGSATAITRSLPTVGIDPKEFRRLSEELGSRSEALFQIIEGRFKGFAKESAKTTIGLVSNIKDAIFVIAADVGEGLLASFRPAVQSIFDFLNRLREDQEFLTEWRERLFGIGRAIVDLSESITRLSETLVSFFKIVADGVDRLGGLKNVLVALASIKISKKLSALLGLGSGVGVKATVGSRVTGLVTALRLLPPQVGIALTVAAGLTAGLKLLSRNTDLASESVPQLSNELGFLASRLAAVGQEGIDAAEGVDKLIGASRAFDLANRVQDMGAPLRKIRADADIDPLLLVNELDVLTQALREGGFEDKADGVNSLMIEVLADYSNVDLHGRVLTQALEVINDLAHGFTGFGLASLRVSEEIEATIVPSLGLVTSAAEEAAEGSEDALKQIVNQFQAHFQVTKVMFERDLITTNEYSSRLETLLGRLSPSIDTILNTEGLSEVQKAPIVTALQSLLDQVQTVSDGLVTEFGEITESINRTQSNIFGDLVTHFIPDQGEGILINSFLDLMRNEISSGIEGVNQDLTMLDLDLQLGDISLAGAETARQKILEKVNELLRTATSLGDKGLVIDLKNLKLELEGAEAVDDMAIEFQQVLATALSGAVQKAGDALADALANMLSPADGESAAKSLKLGLASLMNFMGDSLIQIGIGALALHETLKNITNPIAATAAIAAGIALKAFAGSVVNRVNAMGESMSGASSVATQSFSNEPINFGTFIPSPSFGSQQPVSVTINTMDSKGVGAFIQSNQDAFGQAVVHVAERDRATGGSAFGVFTPDLAFNR